MKRLFFLSALVIFAFTGCSNDDLTVNNGGGEDDLVTPEVEVAINSQGPMTGTLEIFPCTVNSSIYYGNYFNNKQSSLPGLYVLKDGAVSGNPVRPVSLPVGAYDMLYWATTQVGEMITSNPAVDGPTLILGGDLSQQYFTLEESPSDTTYLPTVDLAYAVVPTYIGTDKLSAVLKRQTAGMQVVVKNSNNTALDSSIDSMSVRIGGIAEKLNMYTAAPVNQTKTVAFPLTLSADGMQMSNVPVMLFPSAENPLFQLMITLKNGTVKTFKQALSNSLKTNTQLTLTLTIGDLFSEEDTGGFTIDSWEAESENIDIPSIN